MNAHESVGHRDHVGLGVFGVAEEGVRRPDLVDQVVVECDVFHVLPRRVGVHEARVVPLHAEVAVDRVLLHINKWDANEYSRQIKGGGQREKGNVAREIERCQIVPYI